MTMLWMMVLSTAAVRPSRSCYYRSAKEHCPPNGGPRKRLGGLTVVLGLHGTVTESNLERLFAGIAADVSRSFVQNNGSGGRSSGYELTRSLMKFLTVLHLVGLPRVPAEVGKTNSAACHVSGTIRRFRIRST